MEAKLSSAFRKIMAMVCANQLCMIITEGGDLKADLGSMESRLLLSVDVLILKRIYILIWIRLSICRRAQSIFQTLFKLQNTILK